MKQFQIFLCPLLILLCISNYCFAELKDLPDDQLEEVVAAEGISGKYSGVITNEATKRSINISQAHSPSQSPQPPVSEVGNQLSPREMHDQIVPQQLEPLEPLGELLTPPPAQDQIFHGSTVRPAL